MFEWTSRASKASMQRKLARFSRVLYPLHSIRSQGLGTIGVNQLLTVKNSSTTIC